MIELGAFVLVGFVFMIWFVIQWIRIDNQMLKKKEEWTEQPKWNWD